MNKVKLAVIGFGNLGRTHVSKIMNGECPDIEVVAICDIKPEKLEKAKTSLQRWVVVLISNKIPKVDQVWM